MRLQPGITLCDVERVGVVGDVEQLGDVGLTGVTTIVEPDVALLMEFVVEIDGRCQVHHISDGIDIHTAVVLDEVRPLGLCQHTHVVVVFLLPVAQCEADVVGVVLVFGIAAERTVQEIFQRPVERGKLRFLANPCIPVAIFGSDAREHVDVLLAEVVGLSVALVAVEAQLIAGLQVRSLPEWFAVGGAQHIAAIVAGSGVVAGGEVGGVLSCLVLHSVEPHLVVRCVALLVAADAPFNAHDDVASTRVQSPV